MDNTYPDDIKRRFMLGKKLYALSNEPGGTARLREIFRPGRSAADIFQEFDALPVIGANLSLPPILGWQQSSRWCAVG